MSINQETIERNVAATRRLFEEGFTRGNADVCDKLVSPDAIEHQRGLKGGIEGTKETIRTLHEWFSDFELTIDDLVAHGDRVWIRATGRGLNTGSIFGRPPTGRRITFKELPEGINYYPAFFKRAIEPVINHFKDQPQDLLEAAKTLGGRKAGYGDIAVTIDAFPRVPLTIVLWRGDAEFAPDGNIMFDSTIPDYLPTEDITILCEIIAWRLVRLLKTGGDNPG